MHLPDGVLSLPVAATTGIVSAGAIALSVHRFQRRVTSEDSRIPVLGILAAFVFAAQMVNFPIPGGTSGHLMGAALAAVLLGPWGALLSLVLVLIVQCFLYADGGVTALGANIFNMGIIGGGVGYGAYRACLGRSHAPGRILAAAGIGAWLSIVSAALACAFEISFSGTVAAQAVVPAMTSVHMVIGIGEAIITIAAVGYVLTVRPHIVPAYRPATGPVRLSRREIAVAVTLCIVIAVVLSAFASSAPDGLEKVAEHLGFMPGEEAPPPVAAPMPDYGLPALGEGLAGTAIAGAVGVLLFGAVAWLLYRRSGIRSS